VLKPGKYDYLDWVWVTQDRFLAHLPQGELPFVTGTLCGLRIYTEVRPVDASPYDLRECRQCLIQGGHG
jgi:hypothetical protein